MKRPLRCKWRGTCATLYSLDANAIADWSNYLMAQAGAAAPDRARASLAPGEGILHEEILREFGLNS